MIIIKNNKYHNGKRWRRVWRRDFLLPHSCSSSDSKHPLAFLLLEVKSVQQEPHTQKGDTFYERRKNAFYAFALFLWQITLLCVRKRLIASRPRLGQFWGSRNENFFIILLCSTQSDMCDPRRNSSLRCHKWEKKAVKRENFSKRRQTAELLNGNHSGVAAKPTPKTSGRERGSDIVIT